MLTVYATCPPSTGTPGPAYLAEVARVARWSEAARCRGILVYTDNGLLDPWLVAQAVIAATERLVPLVAVQPVYQHPYAVAKTVATLAHLYGRAVHLNMLAGGFRNDLLTLGDATTHDDRYARTVEYARIVMGLLRGETVTAAGRYYTVTRLRLTPLPPPELLPEVTVSGSSPAGLAAARAIGATAVRYPQRPGEDTASGQPFGMRIGIIAREDADEAWRVAHERFPDDRTGRITHRLAMAVSDSHRHRQLSAGGAGRAEDPYWLGPFRTYRTFCPYLVGSRETVGTMVAEYLRLGARTVILDVPRSPEDLAHAAAVFAMAQELVAA